MTTTARDVATWMLAEFERHGGWLAQADVVALIPQKFGGGFVSENDAGNVVIGRDVLAAFRALSGDDVVWVKTDRIWRRRSRQDPPGRQAD